MKFRSRLMLAVAMLTLWIGLVALQGELPARVEEVIAAVVSFAIMLLGPKPLKAIFDLLGLPGGAVRVIATYVAAGIVGFVALAIAGAISGVPSNLEDLIAMAGLLSLAVQAAYHRLKDLQSI